MESRGQCCGVRCSVRGVAIVNGIQWRFDALRTSYIWDLPIDQNHLRYVTLSTGQIYAVADSGLSGVWTLWPSADEFIVWRVLHQ